VAWHIVEVESQLPMNSQILPLMAVFLVFVAGVTLVLQVFGALLATLKRRWRRRTSRVPGDPRFEQRTARFTR